MGEHAIQTNGHDPAKSTGGEGIQRLRCAVKNYEWGRLGPDSLVARLHEANSGQRVDPAVPFAELWMGTHESAPSQVVKQEEEVGSGHGGSECMVTLKSWVTDNPDLLGSRVVDKWGCDLPFLFKVIYKFSQMENNYFQILFMVNFCFFHFVVFYIYDQLVIFVTLDQSS